MAVSIPGYPENLQPWTIAVSVSMTVLALVSVLLRVLARREKGQALWWDDYMIIFSMAWNLLVIGFVFAMLAEGMGVHVESVPMDSVIRIAKYLVVAEILYVFNLVWTKISILLMFYRIFRFSYIKRAAYVIGTFVVLWVICITFLFIFICVPVEKLWYPDLPGHCIDQVGTWIANAASTILSDMAILLLPIPRIWQLQLRTTDKLALSCAFGLGFFVVFASVYRFTVLFSYSALDPSYTLAPTVGWTVIEMSAGITSACLPTLVPALKLIGRTIGLGRLMSLSTTRGGTREQKGSTGPSAASAPRHEHLKSFPDKDGEFVRLSDDAGVSTDDDRSPRLRPDQDVSYIVTSVPRTKDDKRRTSTDEIPLNSIRVQTDFKQTRS
ncbi:hypothetical protein F4809DRAFT_618075 [Biscogniauxia mediterranea]|nr:hypothetical protein F4809DRAFT_618075 [Biscogniauxia mediterranea]